MSEILNTLGQVRKNWGNYETWEKEQEILEKKKKEYRKHNPVSAAERAEAEKYGRTIINAINVMDEYSEDKAEDMEQAVQTASIIPVEAGLLGGSAAGGILGFKIAKGKYLMPILIAGQLTGMMAAFIPTTILGTKLQIWASKVARFQAREEELKDPKNFVIYTDQQMQKAEEIAKTMPDEKEDNSLMKKIPFREAIGNIKSVFRDRKKHEEWYKKYKQEDEKIKASYPNGLPDSKAIDAKKDQQIITNTIKKINLNAEEYSENVETLAGTVGVPASMATSGLGLLATNFILKQLEKAKAIKPDGFLAKNKAYMAIVGGMLAMTPVIAWFTKMQKDSARIGRYMAKQELLSDPNNFVYTDKEKVRELEVNTPEKHKNIFTNFIDNLKFFPKLLKESKDYSNYKKTETKEEAKLRKALEKVEVSEAQMERAKNLQEKVFNSFEKIDEMSQKYSESAEILTDTVGQPIAAFYPYATLGAMAGLGYLARGKIGKALTIENINKFGSSIGNGYKKIKDSFIGFMFKNKHVNNFTSKLSNEFKDGVDFLEAKISFKKTVENVSEYKLRLPDIFKAVFGLPGNHRLKTVAGIALSPLAVITLAPMFMIQSFFTGINKKAGKIGVMKAMEELEDPRYFVDTHSTGNTNNQPQKPQNEKLSQKLQRLMKIRNMAA